MHIRTSVIHLKITLTYTSSIVIILKKRTFLFYREQPESPDCTLQTIYLNLSDIETFLDYVDSKDSNKSLKNELGLI